MILYGFPYAFPLKRPKLAGGVQEMNDFIWFSELFPLKRPKLAGDVQEMSDFELRPKSWTQHQML